MDNGERSIAEAGHCFEAILGAGSKRVEAAQPIEDDADAGLQGDDLHPAARSWCLQARRRDRRPSSRGLAAISSERWCRIYRKRAFREGEHGCVVNGVPEDRIRIR